MLPGELRPRGSENMKKFQKRFIRPLGADNTAKHSKTQLERWSAASAEIDGDAKMVKNGKSPYLGNYSLASFKELMDRVLGICPNM